MDREPGTDRTNRRGCLLVVVAIVATLALITALGVGWLGRVDGNKSDDIPAIEG